MKNLRLELDDMVLIGRHGDFGKAVDPLEDDLEKVMIAVDSGLEEVTLVDLDGDLEIEKIYQLQENTTEDEVRQFVTDNIEVINKEVRYQIANLIDS